MRAFAGGQRREMAATAEERRGVSIAVACRAFGVSETCYRYSPLLSDENEPITDLLVGLTEARTTWGFGLCFLHLRNVKGHSWNHNRVYRIYCALELNLRSEPWNAIGPRDNGEGLYRALQPHRQARMDRPIHHRNHRGGPRLRHTMALNLQQRPPEHG